MKKHLLLPLALLSFHICGAQETTTPTTRQFGFDGAAFLSRFVNFSGTGNSQLSTYYLTYKKNKGDKNTRFGIGASLAVEGDGNDGINSANSINFRAGTERFQDFGKQMGLGDHNRWRAFYGWDFKTSLSFASSGNTDNSSTLVALGAAPVFGLQFRLNERLSFSTEMAYNLFLTFRDTGGNSRLSGSTNFDAPRALYVNFDF